ncbi:uncharacterized protein LOC127842882 [Dreissena polymorpha]|nr:uncharacterized protein LOC127842882 [Dreissena polymorpha]XP_052228604.1 uncharacterized protein LOC127842882 [Dreissena polymorpha]XP_052228605.1 uncharacterized protein LOC127842882 [Dreissena polymorpha]XP_052228606.1 uncharacterized protein LOC127842882 [Dreissena polymorpha]XP_052228607.1 uncharacterized protein LOC127842882 [Dreissena polymorpha]
MSLAVKASHCTEIRRFSIPKEHEQEFSYLEEKLTNIFTGMKNKDIQIFWKDPDGDLVMFSTDEEYSEALKFVHDNLFRIYIHSKEAQHHSKSVQTSISENNIRNCTSCGAQLKCLACDDFSMDTAISNVAEEYGTPTSRQSPNPGSERTFKQSPNPTVSDRKPTKSWEQHNEASFYSQSPVMSPKTSFKEFPSSTSLSGARKCLSMEEKLVRSLCKQPGPMIAMRNVQRHVSRSTAENVRVQMASLQNMGFGKIIVSTLGKVRREFMCKPAPCSIAADAEILKLANMSLEAYTDKFQEMNEDYNLLPDHYQYELIADLFEHKINSRNDSDLFQPKINSHCDLAYLNHSGADSFVENEASSVDSQEHFVIKKEIVQYDYERSVNFPSEQTDPCDLSINVAGV